MFPVEYHGFLSLSLAPCGQSVLWSLTRRPLPPTSAARDALSREGQDNDQEQSTEDDHVPESFLVPRHLLDKEHLRGVVMLDDSYSRKELFSNGDIFSNSKFKISKVHYAVNFNKNNARYVMKSPSSYTKNVSDTLRSVNNSEEMRNPMNLKLIETLSNSFINIQAEEKSRESQSDNTRKLDISLPDEKYEQQNSVRNLLSGEYRKTNKGLFSLKNLAYDIEQSDYFNNELEKSLYRNIDPKRWKRHVQKYTGGNDLLNTKKVKSRIDSLQTSSNMQNLKKPVSNKLYVDSNVYNKNILNGYNIHQITQQFNKSIMFHSPRFHGGKTIDRWRSSGSKRVNQFNEKLNASHICRSNPVRLPRAAEALQQTIIQSRRSSSQSSPITVSTTAYIVLDPSDEDLSQNKRESNEQSPAIRNLSVAISNTTRNSSGKENELTALENKYDNEINSNVASSITSIRDLIKSIWKRPSLSSDNEIFDNENISTKTQTIWGLESTYEELDSGTGDKVWIFQRYNATPGIYVITVGFPSSRIVVFYFPANFFISWTSSRWTAHPGTTALDPVVVHRVPFLL